MIEIKSSSTLRNQHIDFLRGIAILLVLLLHFHLAYHIDQSALTNIFSSNFINAIARNGNYGVTMFFVISGFLITSKSLERYGKLGNMDVLGFFILRFARIIPCLLLVLLVILFFNFIQIPIFKNNPGTTSLSLAYLSVLTFWHNVLMAKFGYFNYCLNIYWSLSVEEIFYLSFPILCLLLKRPRFLVSFWIALIILAPIYRCFYANNEIVSMYGYLSCFDAIAIGCCTALIINNIKFKKWSKQLKHHFIKIIQYAIAFALITIYLYADVANNMTMGFSLVAICTALLLAAGTIKQKFRNCNARKFKQIFCWFGENSYELYLFHIVVLALMRTIYHSSETLSNYSKLLWMAIFFFASIVLAGTIAKFYSQPTNKNIRQSLSLLRHQYDTQPENIQESGLP
jgi:peptidoglycan/LPS O-acetylase OafA/YrhL